MEIVLLVVVTFCVIALVYINKKRTALEKDFVATSNPAGASCETDISISADQEQVGTSDSSQNTIYEFSAKVGMRLCPFCDGENGARARICNICGRDI